MRIGMHLTTVCVVRRSSSRSRQRDRENLILHILTRISIAEAHQAIQESQVRTKLIRAGILRLQVGIIDRRTTAITHLSINRISDADTRDESTTEATLCIIIRIVLPGHTHLRIRGTNLTKSQYLVLQRFQFREDESNRDGGIEESTIATRHRGYLIDTSRRIQIEHTLVGERKITKETHRTFLCVRL